MANENSIALKPCKLCDGKGNVSSRKEDDWYVSCCDCGYHTGYFGRKDLAITAWNTRVSEGSNADE